MQIKIVRIQNLLFTRFHFKIFSHNFHIAYLPDTLTHRRCNKVIKEGISFVTLPVYHLLFTQTLTMG